MAENNESFHRQSLYMHTTIQQVSEEQAPTTADSSPSASMIASTFGSEFRLMCAICLRDLNQPKQLKGCYHIFCKDCLEPFVDSAEGGYVVCPLQYCGRSCPKEDISKALRSDSYMHAFEGHIGVHVESGDLFCTNECREASVFCLECGENFCETCQSDHGCNEEFKKHHVLRLFKTPATMTIDINRRPESFMASSLDESDMDSSEMYKCPICRNTDWCEHEKWLKDLKDDDFRQSDRCPIPDHADGNRLIAYCVHPDCERPICRNCSVIEHKTHRTMDIGTALKEKLPDLNFMKKSLTFQTDIFEDAVTECNKAENNFRRHILQVEQEMIGRKAAMHNHVEEAFNVAFSLIEQTGRKQAELNQQSRGMHQELLFLKKATQLADGALKEGAPSLEIVRVWKGLKLIFEDLGLGEGDKKKSQEPEVVMPQRIVEKRLVLPAPSCMNPDLHVLQKVGVENTVLCQAFSMKLEGELLFSHSILPLTQTEAWLACKPSGGKTEVVEYSYVDPQHRPSLPVAKGADFCITDVSGNGIVATLYDAPGGFGGAQGKNQVLFWEQALDISMRTLAAQGVDEKMRVIATTSLPPQGLAVTSDNHVVVCTATDPLHTTEASRESCILVMTLQGDIVCRRLFNRSQTGLGSHLNFPRYVTVNINDDICVTDEKDQSVSIFNRQLQNKLRIVNPYGDRDDLNRNFSPRGICHDSFGRLIVADSNNNAVLRMEYDDVKVKMVKTILKNREDEVTDLDSPRLVAMGKGATDQSSRLWVVCRDNIQVFDYTDKE